MKQKIKISKEDKQKAEEIASGTIIGDKVITYSEIKYDAAMQMAKYKNHDFSNFLNILLMQSNIGQIYTLIEEKLKNL